MSNYKKPVISIDNGLAEGVYAASGCYTASAWINQTPALGRGNYVIGVSGVHSANHTKEAQTLTISFNQNVKYVHGGSLISGDNTPTLQIALSYHQNGSDNLRFVDLTVESDAGLNIESVKITD